MRHARKEIVARLADVRRAWYVALVGVVGTRL